MRQWREEASKSPPLVRWYVLFLFSVFAYAQCANWMTFSCVPKYSKQVYNMTESDVDLLLNWGPIIFIPFVVFTSWLLTTHNGVKRTVMLGFFVTFAGGLLRLVPTWTGSIAFTESRWARLLLHAAQILNAAGGPVSMGAASRVSSHWFPVEQRTRATAMPFIFSGIGQGVTSLVGPYMVTGRANFPNLLYLTGVVSTFPFVCALVYFPASPADSRPWWKRKTTIRGNFKSINVDDDVSIEGEKTKKKVGFVSGIAKVLCNYSALSCFVAGGLMGGTTDAYLSTLPTTWNDEKLSETKGDWINSMSVIASVLGGLSVSYLVDKFFARKLKDVMIALTVLSIVFFFALVYAPYLDVKLFTTTQFWFLEFCSFVFGFVQGARDPIIEELTAELTYPADEGTSAGVYTCVYNAGALVLIFAASSLPVVWLGICTLASLALALLLLVLVKEEYRRRDSSVCRE